MSNNSSFISLGGAIVSLLSMVIAVVTCSVVQKEAERSIERIKFHAEISEDTLVFFQISGDSYHVPRLEITPTFRVEGTENPYSEAKPFNLNIVKYINMARPAPFYEIRPLSEIVCRRQSEIDCSKSPLVKIRIVYDIFDESRPQSMAVE